MIYRESTMNDISGILNLQEKNLVSNLTDKQKLDGFVTTPFVEEQLLRLIDLDGLFVIDKGSEILGYAVAAGWDYFKGRSMFDYMIERFQKIEYEGIRIKHDNSFQYGPVCIDSNLRGTDSFPRLFCKMKERMCERFIIGATFINKVNTRSMKAHTRKVKLDIIDEFQFNNNDYYGLAFLCR